MAEEDYIPLPAASEAGGSTPAPAKRMRKNEDRVNTTLFISSLPYTATTTDLLTHFSYLGPVRHGFVATDKASGKSKGVGYVTYSLREDAEQAVAELDNKDFGGEGRKIRVAWADHKPSTRERAARPAPDPTKIIQPGNTGAAAGDEDPNAFRTLVLSDLPEVDRGTLWKKVRKVNDAIELVYPVEGQAKVAHLVFPSAGDAYRGQPKLHGHTYKGVVLSAVLKKRADRLGASGKGPSHAGRLIVRNLPWDAREDDLRATFLPYGAIQEITIPTVPSKLPARNGKPAPPRLRGFAFVWFTTKSDAEKAIAGANGKAIARAQGKTWKSEIEKKKGDERVIAVDWALSKEKWREMQGEDGDVKMEDVKAEEDGKDEEGDGEEADGSDEDDGSDDSGEEDEDGSSEEEEGSDGDEEQVEVEGQEPIKPQLPTVDVGSTLFVRNLPFEVTEQELNSLFRTFGPLRYARITIDKSTGRSRGTGFVCFWKTEHADAAIEEAERVQAETGAYGSAGATGANATAVASTAAASASKNPFALPSVLTVDPSSSLASKLVIQGRTLDVTRAVTREQAGTMKEDGERARQAGDKRNTYLMREGVVFPNSPAAQTLPAAEIERRQESFNSRRTLLRSNPSLYISKTRLSIRQLPLFVTDRGLKRLAIYAVRQFDAEVTAENREGLSRVEESDPTLSPALEARADSGADKGKAKASGKSKFFKHERETPVMQSKVVRQSEKLDPLTNLGKSKGYGFLEMRSHKEALKVLRWANNNPEVGPLVWGWWREEMQDLLKRAQEELAKRRKAHEAGEVEKEDKEKEAKNGKVKETLEELESRVRKLDERTREGDEHSGGGMRGGKTLLIEFSIENVQVVRRRVGKISAARTDAQHSRPRQDEDRQPSSASQSLYAAGAKRKAAEDTDDEDAAPPRSASRAGGRGKDGRPNHGRDGGRGDRGDRNEKEGGRPKRGKFSKDGQVEGKGQQQGEDKPREKRGIEKQGDHLGSLIGRKRKMRRGGK